MSAKDSKNYYHDLYKDIKANGEKAEALKDLKAAGNAEGKIMLGMLTRVVSEISESEFCDYFEKQELPPIKLTNAEMNLLKGGGGWDNKVKTQTGPTWEAMPAPGWKIEFDRTTEVTWEAHGQSGVFREYKNGQAGRAIPAVFSERG